MYKKKLPIFFFIVTIALCSLAEIILLEVKYQFFAGGFLQSHQLITVGQKLSFIFIILLFNIFLYGSAFLIWNYFLTKLKVPQNIIAFHFMLIAGIITTVSLVFQFQLHKYFSDAMDLALIKNIAGGNIQNAIAYVLDETFLFIVGFIILTIIYFLLYKVTKPLLIKYGENSLILTSNKRNLKIVKYYFFSLAIIVTSILMINKNESLRYNLNRSNAFYMITSSLDYISDIDRDGYGSFHFPTDNEILNSSVHPNALDIPDNGIDEDGFLGDFKNITPDVDIIIDTDHKKKHVILIVLESTRAEIIGKSINNEFVAPNLMALSKEGQYIKEAYSHTGYTTSSLASLFSGKIGISDKKKSILSILKQNGYQTAIFSGQDASFGGNDVKFNYKKNIDYFYDAQVGINERVYETTLPSGIQVSESTLWHKFKKYSDILNWKQPQFIYVNMQAAHFPYHHKKMTMNLIDKAIPRSEINVENKEWLQKTYWNATNYADIYVGKIINELKEKNIWQNTLLIITGDHGEELFDNNHLGHGFFLSDVQTHIPLILNDKKFQITQPVGHSDIKNIIISNALNHSNKMQNNWYPKRKSVFQYLGSLNNPGKISLRYSEKKQITFDLRKMLIRPIGQNKWITFAEAIKISKVKVDIQKLITHWENLRWQSFLKKTM